MKNAFENARRTRNRFLELMERHSLATVNEIPNGFNNNLLWNFGHVIVTQQLLLYKLSGQEMRIADDIVERYRKGSKPGGKAPIGEWRQLMEIGRTSIDWAEADYEAGKFANYQPYKTEAGFQLNTAEDAIPFLPIHESIHLGYSLALKRMLG